MATNKNYRIRVILLLITFIGVFPLDVLLPSFPSLAGHFSKSTDDISLSLSIFIICFSLAQLFIGPLSDLLGRKRLIITGLCLATTGAIGAVFTTDFNSFLTFRALQAFGCGSFVLVNAIIQDTFTLSERHKVRIFMTTAGGIFISTAPALGSALQFLANWRGSFIFFIITNLSVTLLTLWWLPKDSVHSRPSTRPRGYPQITAIMSRDFILNSVLSAIGFSCHFAFIAQSPIIFLEELSLPPTTYSLILLFYGIAYLTGGFVARSISSVISRRLQITTGLFTMLCAGAALYLSSLLATKSVINIMVPMIICTCGVTILRSAATTAAMDSSPSRPGAASSLHNTIIFAFGAITSALVNFSSTAPILSLSAALLVLPLIGILVTTLNSQVRE